MNSFLASIPTFRRGLRAIFWRLFSRRLWTRIAFAIACLATIWALFCAVERSRWKRQWEAYAADAHAHGTRLEIVEFAPPSAPPADNLSTFPYFGDFYRDPMPPDGLSGHVFERLLPLMAYLPTGPETPAAKVQAMIRSLAEPPRRLRKGGEIPTEDFGKTVREIATGDSMPEMSTAMLKVLDQECGPVWEQLRQTVEHPELRFPPPWPGMMDTSRQRSLWPFLRVRKAAQLAGIRLTLHSAAGNGAAALDDFAVPLRLSRAMEGEPTLVSAMINVAIVQLAVCQVWDGLAAGVWDENQLGRVDELLRGIDLVAVYRYGLETERASTNSMFQQFYAVDFTALRNFDLHFGPPKREFEFPMSMYPAGWIYRSQLKLNESYDRMVAGTDPARHTLALSPNADRALKSSHTFRDKLYLLAMPNLSRAGARALVVEATLRQARVACAFERYRLRHGAYPAKLEDLIQEHLIATLPHDPANDAPMEYRHLEDTRYALKAPDTHRIAREASVIAADWPDAWIPAKPAR